MTFNQFREMESAAKRREIAAIRRAEMMANIEARKKAKAAEKEYEFDRMNATKDNIEKNNRLKKKRLEEERVTRNSLSLGNGEQAKFLKQAERDRLKEYELFELQSNLFKSEALASKRERVKQERKHKHECEVFGHESRRALNDGQRARMKEYEEHEIQSNSSKSELAQAAKAGYRMEARSVRHQLNVAQIENWRMNRAAEKERERLANEAIRNATFAGLMDPYMSDPSMYGISF